MRSAALLAVALTGFVGLHGSTGSAQAQRLEDAILGSYAASGTIRRTPDSQPERIVCRLNGDQRSTTGFRFSGRCATGNRSGGLAMDLTVREPGSRYHLSVRIRARDLQSDRSRFEYRGNAQNNRTTFMADFAEGGKSYRSSMVLHYSSRGVSSISETVTDLATGKTSTLLDLEVQRR